MSKMGSSPLLGTLQKLARRQLLPQGVGSDRPQLYEMKQSNLCCPGRGREGFSQKKNRDNSTYFAPEAWQRLLLTAGLVPGKQGFSACLPTLRGLTQVLQQDSRSGWSWAAGAHSGVPGLTAESICQADHPSQLLGNGHTCYPLSTDVGD